MRCLAGIFLVTACASEPQDTQLPVPQPVAPAAIEDNDPRWHEALLAIAAGYTTWGRVEDEMRWAPWLCRMPMPARARISDSGDDETHGRKLYTLYAKDPVAYGAQPSATPPADAATLPDLAQVVVKEAWLPVVSDTPVQGMAGGERRENLLPALHEGKAYVPGERAGLYVLFKPVKTDIDTDAGWVYGTITADGKTVTSAGKVASCMGCHREASHERLFGLPADAPAGAKPAGG